MSCYLDFHKKRAVRNVTGFFSFQTCLSSKCFKSKIEENQLFRKPLSRSCYRHIAFFHCFLQCLIVHFTFLKLKSCVDFNKWKSCNFSCKAQIPAGNMQTRALVKKFKKMDLLDLLKNSKWYLIFRQWIIWQQGYVFSRWSFSEEQHVKQCVYQQDCDCGAVILKLA